MLALGQTPGDILAASRFVWLVANAVLNFPPLSLSGENHNCHPGEYM